MAEAMLLGVAKSVLGQLSSPALKEFLLVWNFEKDLKRLGETIETITCFIYDAEQRHSKEHFVKLWLSRLKAVLYDADDLFDSIAARTLRKKAMDGSTSKKAVTLFFSKSNHLGFVIKTAHDIKGIRKRLDNIKDDMSMFQFQYLKIEAKSSHSVLEREERHSFVDNKEVIGRDREKEDIITLLLSEGSRQPNLEVISVIGFGGLGKTTLAQLVYNNERVQNGFDMCLWTCINYFSDLKSVLVKILESERHELHLEKLQKELRKKIEGKKYLLVLDDVWDENASNWGELKTLLNCGKIGSKVLITTRKIRVAQCLDALEPFYNLGIMSEESAWSLFVKMAFKDGGFVGDSELESLGKQIIHKCGYVPLLVKIVGRVLSRKKKDKEVWLSFLEKEFAGVVSGDTGDVNVMQVLKVSYNDLPDVLKRCFAYCSVFPEDHVFHKDELVCMWIAQGFVEPFGGKSLEEVGDAYFFSMIDACFFQEVKEELQDYGVVRYECKMHDLLRELAIHVAGSESISYTKEAFRNMNERSVLRHISINHSSNSLSCFSDLSSYSKSLRTLRFTNAYHIEISSLKLVLENFRNLRTLVLSSMGHTALPDSFGGLIHLRYLDLSRNSNLTSLPKSICKLHHLQTLLLEYCPNLVKFPSTLMKLMSLRHLLLNGCSKLDSMPPGFEALTSLVSLDRFIMHPDHGGLRYLDRLDNLCGTLTLRLPMNGWIDCVEDAKKANMSRKRRLSGFSIKWIGFSHKSYEDVLKGEERKAVLEELQPHADLQYLRIEEYTSNKLPRWFFSPSRVKELNLAKCRNLEYLDESARCDCLLPCLEVLVLFQLRRLRGWSRGETEVSNNAPRSTVQRMPRVSKLDIYGCWSLTENMPVFDALEDLSLGDVNVSLVYMLLITNPDRLRSPRCHNINLQVLRIFHVESLYDLPECTLKHLTALKHLSIARCENLRWVSRCGLACLTSLEELCINDCGDVRLEDEVYNIMEIGNNNNNMYYGWHRLHKLDVPWQSDVLQEGLRFLTSLKDLNITYYEEQQVEADNQNSDCCDFAAEKLKSVVLSFGSMSCCFPKWTLHLPYLQELELRSIRDLNIDDSVAQQTQSTTLVTLRIYSKEDLLWVHDIPWNLIPSLRTLIFDGKLISIPDGIQQLTSLHYLKIQGSQNVKEIPKWMINLTSLQELHLKICSPELKARCDRETGIDWHLISHIPTIVIDRSY